MIWGKAPFWGAYPGVPETPTEADERARCHLLPSIQNVSTGIHISTRRAILPACCKCPKYNEAALPKSSLRRRPGWQGRQLAHRFGAQHPRKYSK